MGVSYMVAVIAITVPIHAQSTSSQAAQARSAQPNAYPTTNQSGDRYASAVPINAEPTSAEQLAAARWLLQEASTAMTAGDLAQAEELTAEASRLNITEELFTLEEMTPSKMAWQLQQAHYRMGTEQRLGTGQQETRQYDSNVVAAGGAIPMKQENLALQAYHLVDANGQANADSAVQPAAALLGPSLKGESDANRLAQLPLPFESALPLESVKAETTGASDLLADGEQALRDRDLRSAYDLFRAAAERREELTSSDKQRLEGHLRMLSAAAQPAPARNAASEIGPTGIAPEPVATPFNDSMIDSADADQKLLARQLSTTVGQVQVESRSIRKAEPRRSLEMLEKVKAEVESSGLNKQFRDQLARRVDRSLAETKTYIENNRSQIELDEKNASVLADIDRKNATKQKVREDIQVGVEKFNDLIDEQRFEEAEVVAMRLRELAPNDPVTKQVWENAKFIRQNMFNEDMREQRSITNLTTYNGVEMAGVHNIRDGHEMDYGTDWDTVRDRKSISEANSNRSPRELEIQRRLETPVQFRYDEKPLGEVMDDLAQMSGINIHLDNRGLIQEGVSSSTPVTINITSEISLKSALNLILEQYHLGYSINDEVLKITSETLRDGNLIRDVYYVADLVIPIPNFVPDNNIGLQGLINDAMASAGRGASALNPRAPIAMTNGPSVGAPGMGPDGAILPQNLSGGGQFGGASQPMSTGPGGLGGAAAADFDSLIDLIVSTVANDTWAENGGGEAEIRSFPTNLSLVVSQTQSVHEEIADLLEQLRRLQDLQVTIEVRFIRLSDDFFERIGIDFDMNINDTTSGFADIAAGGSFETPRSSGTVGATAAATGDLPVITADLDLPFRQGGFDVAVPTFGGFNPTQAATFGFAILSDIEAYFLINAAQGDSRTNVLNAPKVTLFNGQQAFVSDTSQSPFVISVIPVVGEFAAAQQPVIVVLSEGTLMSIQAVVSDDRRYVRLTVVPFFSEIGDVDTFTFDGQTTTNSSSSSSATDADDDGVNESANNAQDNDSVIAGTTVQLPTFQFVSVTTTVSVPDGGTVLLGGIKRLSEGREEFGVPLLSKVPYINRLFRNVGIGRETNSLMMMVTPRIIIQEEEEERLGIAAQ